MAHLNELEICVFYLNSGPISFSVAYQNSSVEDRLSEISFMQEVATATSTEISEILHLCEDIVANIYTLYQYKQVVRLMQETKFEKFV